MATEETDGFDQHFRSVTVTAIAALAGVAAALISMQVTGAFGATTAQQLAAAAKDQRAQMIVLGLVLLQPLVLRATGLMKDDFGLKDFLFIGFMTFSMWFVTWGILLTTGVTG